MRNGGSHTLLSSLVQLSLCSIFFLFLRYIIPEGHCRHLQALPWPAVDPYWSQDLLCCTRKKLLAASRRDHPRSHHVTQTLPCIHNIFVSVTNDCINRAQMILVVPRALCSEDKNEFSWSPIPVQTLPCFCTLSAFPNNYSII